MMKGTLLLIIPPSEFDRHVPTAGYPQRLLCLSRRVSGVSFARNLSQIF